MFLDLYLNTFLSTNIWYCLIKAQKLESWGKEEGVDGDDIDMEGQQGGQKKGTFAPVEFWVKCRFKTALEAKANLKRCLAHGSTLTPKVQA